MSGCSADMAQKIVQLLMDDHNTASSYCIPRIQYDEPPAPTICLGCNIEFIPAARHRQYCSRECFVRVRTGGPHAEYIAGRAGLASAAAVRAEVLNLFGLTIGVSTICRHWAARAKAVSEGQAQPAKPIYSPEDYQC